LQCISTIALVKNETEVLDSPVWIILINVVALEMLKAKMPRFPGQWQLSLLSLTYFYILDTFLCK
jgi:hypothetical protein